MKVAVKPQLLRWARERVSWDVEAAANALGIKDAYKVSRWEETGELSFAQLQRLAAKTYTPIGCLFLSEPPEEQLPVTDFRLMGPDRPMRPSPNLLDTIYACQMRQAWFHDYLARDGADPLPFVGSATEADDPARLAHRIRETFGLTLEDRHGARTYEETLSRMIDKIEQAGILAMNSGVVLNNTQGKLDVNEFRGFALSDRYAPLIFVNAADAKAAQMFTLVHEVAHVWLGQSGVSKPTLIDDQATESYCNAVAAEILVPIAEFQEAWNRHEDVPGEVARLAHHFKASTLVILIRALQAHILDRPTFERLYGEQRKAALATRSGGGDFYRTQNSRLGSRFTRAVITSTLEGKTSYTEAFSLLGIRKSATFNETARRLGFAGGAAGVEA